MEKDYFKDRSIEATKIDEITTGSYVYICTKKNQKIATKIEHLTFGKVVSVLTGGDHPRGIKTVINIIYNPHNGIKKMTTMELLSNYVDSDEFEVLPYPEAVAKRKEKYGIESIGMAVGRVVYLTDMGKLITKK